MPTVLKRAHFKCEFCDLINGQIVFSVREKWIRKGKTVYRKSWQREVDPNSSTDWKAVRVVLTVAHLDHDSSNHKVELHRLAALCQLCHLRYDALHKAKTRIEKLKAVAKAVYYFADDENFGPSPEINQNTSGV